MVLNTRELLPEPETPVNTVSRRFGISMLTSLRLFSRAPCTRIRSWLSATCGAGDRVSFLVAMLVCSIVVRAGSGPASGLRAGSPAPALREADHVARRVAEVAVADAVRLVDRLLQHLGAGGLDALEDG